jgi:antitoxin (DNA-binding transcriptional repressor) of toxin-antitoxin stability system
MKAEPRQLSAGVTATTARRVSATDAARSFSDVLNRVQYRGETIVVERGGTPICEIAPARPLQFKLSDLAALLRAAPKPDAGYWDALEEILQRQAPVQSSPWGR